VDFRDTPEEAAFRQEVSDFLKTELREEWKAKPDEGEEDVQELYERRRPWRQKLGEKGWTAPAWPREYGGAGLTVMQQFIMNEEFAEARAPARDVFGVGMVGPTLIVHGSEEQKKEHLPRILSGETRWCQGYSEPEAGSDLASLRTRALKDGDDYIINGQKIWTSVAQHAHWIFMLARTDPDAPRHRGISYFLVDMKTPGIEVRPLVDLSGRHMFNETFFENVRVPARNLVGEENRGWYIGTTTLDFERSNVGAAVSNRLLVEDLAGFIREHAGEGVCTLPRHQALRHELADRAIEANVARMLSVRVVALQAKGLIPNYEASVVKTYASELTQRIYNTGVKVLGLYGGVRGDEAPVSGRYARGYLQSAGSTIAAGTSEIQRNIVAIRGLGLPRD
jgi:alkylation response protein AidB-like acyl-CoA dehydrogenase